MTKKLSPTMQRTLDKANEHGGELVNWRGGFWTYQGCTTTRTEHFTGFKIPDWYVGSGTIKALADRGIVEFTERTGSGWPIRAKVISK
jgi:hypothetical protein